MKLFLGALEILTVIKGYLIYICTLFLIFILTQALAKLLSGASLAQASVAEYWNDRCVSPDFYMHESIAYNKRQNLPGSFLKSQTLITRFLDRLVSITEYQARMCSVLWVRELSKQTQPLSSWS